MSKMRKLKRIVARNRMKQMGLTKINKHSKDMPSYFALHWRDYVR